MMNSNLPPHPFVFFSYSSENRALVMRLKSDLQSYGVNTWTDQNLLLGMNWHEETNKAIKTADAVIMIPSSNVHSSASRLDEELQIANAFHRYVLSLPVGGAAVAEPLPSQTQLKTNVDRDKTGYEQLLSLVIQRLAALGLFESLRDTSNSATLPALVPDETSSSEIHEADYDTVMAFFEELEPHYSKTNQILADL